MSFNSEVKPLKAHDILMYIDEVENYIIDLIDIILIKHIENPYQNANDIIKLADGLQARGINLDLNGKTSIFGRSNDYASLPNEHFPLNDKNNSNMNCIPPQLTSKMLTSQLKFNNLLNPINNWKNVESELPVSIQVNNKPTIDTLFSSPNKSMHDNNEPTGYTGLHNNYSIEEEISWPPQTQGLDNNSSASHLDINSNSKENTNGLAESTLENRTTTDIKSETKSIKLKKRRSATLSTDFFYEQPTKKLKIQLPFKHQPSLQRRIKPPVPVENNLNSKINIIKDFSVKPDTNLGIKPKSWNPKFNEFEIITKSTDELVRSTSIHFPNKVAMLSHFEAFYVIKQKQIKILNSKLSHFQDQNMDVQWELIQNKIKTKLIEIELNQFFERSEKSTAKRTAYQPYFLFLFEYPMMILKGQQLKSEVEFKKMYCVTVCQNLNLSLELAHWISRRAKSLSRANVRLCKRKDNIFSTNIYLFGKKGNEQAFFDNKTIIQGFLETLRILLLEVSKKTVISLYELNAGAKLPFDFKTVKVALQSQLELIYTQELKVNEVPKIADINLLTCAFIDLFSESQ